MNIVRRTPAWYPSLMNDFFARDFSGDSATFSSTLPAVNIQERDNTFELELAVPGLEKKDIEISVEEDTLIIAAQKQHHDDSEGKYSRKEFSYQSFRRAFALPESIDVNKIDASSSNGVLQITLPKRKEALPQPKRMIKIR
ncbi:MAG: Hsp20/alpha crystallin family protein [Flavobacteriaceae bacterium]